MPDICLFALRSTLTFTNLTGHPRERLGRDFYHTGRWPWKLHYPASLALACGQIQPIGNTHRRLEERQKPGDRPHPFLSVFWTVPEHGCVFSLVLASSDNPFLCGPLSLLTRRVRDVLLLPSSELLHLPTPLQSLPHYNFPLLNYWWGFCFPECTLIGTL